MPTRSLFILFVAALLLSACQGAVTATPTVYVLPTATVAPTLPPTSTTAPPTATLVPPTETSLPPSPVPPTSAAPTIAPSGQTVLIYLIALEDNGQSGPPVGCGDSAIPVTVAIPHTTGVLRAALTQLLSLRDAYYGESGLYNALYQSSLQLENVTIENGTAIVQLSGTLMLGGVCDNPRVQAQLEQTALQFSTVRAVSITVNGVPLQELLSQQ